MMPPAAFKHKGTETMKRLLAILLLCTASAIAQERNPHAGFTNLIVPERDHKNVTRLDPPEAFRNAITGMQYGIARPTGANRAITGHVIPFAHEVAAGKPQTFGIFEERWWEPFANAGDPWFVESLSGRVRILRYHHPAAVGVGTETYSDMLDVDPGRKYASLFKTFKTGYVGLGADMLKVHGTGIVQMGLGDNTVRIIPKHSASGNKSRIAVASDFVTVKDGKVYLRISVGTGETKYGLELTKLDW